MTIANHELGIRNGTNHMIWVMEQEWQGWNVLCKCKCRWIEGLYKHFWVAVCLYSRHQELSAVYLGINKMILTLFVQYQTCMFNIHEAFEAGFFRMYFTKNYQRNKQWKTSIGFNKKRFVRHNIGYHWFVLMTTFRRVFDHRNVSLS